MHLESGCWDHVTGIHSSFNVTNVTLLTRNVVYFCRYGLRQGNAGASLPSARSSHERRMYTCHMVPASGFKMHLVLVDEADQMSTAAQLLLLSKLDGTAFPPNTVFVFTCNAVDRLEDRFLSRCKVLEFSTYGLAADAVSLLARVWQTEAPSGSESPNFARIVKESNNNVRES